MKKNKQEKTERFNIRFTKEIKDKLERISEDLAIPMGSVITMLIKKYPNNK
jgi:antitoxin component of RelBE/YafQ-DinJ toxin-antitoxin module